VNFEKLLHQLKDFDPHDLTSKNEKLSFWINVYNIAAIQLIIENNPVNSIKDIGSFFSSVWDRKTISVNNRLYSMAYIEHDILRKMKDPRIHFAIVCASLSCPDLKPYSYKTASLDKQLDDSIVQFLANPTKGLIENKKNKRLEISQIFKWFKEDFKGEKGILSFLSQYKNRDYLNYKIDYLNYDWRLNSRL